MSEFGNLRREQMLREIEAEENEIEPGSFEWCVRFALKLFLSIALVVGVALSLYCLTN